MTSFLSRPVNFFFDKSILSKRIRTCRLRIVYLILFLLMPSFTSYTSVIFSLDDQFPSFVYFHLKMIRVKVFDTKIRIFYVRLMVKWCKNEFGNYLYSCYNDRLNKTCRYIIILSLFNDYLLTLLSYSFLFNQLLRLKYILYTPVYRSNSVR